MARISPVHYIAPSAISITPNANGTFNDLAVYIVNETKIKVYSPRAGIGMENGQYKEWILTGRNRRLQDSAKPYTIYARLHRYDDTSGYLIFAPKIREDNEWKDKYSYVTTDGQEPAAGTQYDDATFYYIRLGDVSLPENGQRTVTLDTGILGTEQFNNEYALNPDALPLRIELGCTINDEDVGSTPYIYWDQQLVLTATLVEGWTGTDIKRFDHWEIARNSGSDSNASWPSQQRQEAFASSGSITLSHTKGADDDFASAVSALYTITAWGHSEDPEDQTLVVLATACISILAETVEKYELSCSADIVSYNPQTESYTPSGGVAVRFRATDQRGDVFMLTKKQFDDSGISVAYAPVGSSSWTQLTPSGAPNVVATVTVPASAFTSQQSVNVRLLNSVGKELATKTIAFVRDGEDSKEREWIFFRSSEAIIFGDLLHPYPSNISYGEVDPAGAAGHITNDKNQEGWVPETWWDEMQGTDEENRFEYGAYRDFVHDETNGGHWGDFTTPKLWGHYGKDGNDGKSVARLVMERTLLTVKTDSEGRTIADVSTIIPFSVILDNMPLTIVKTSIEEGGTTHYVTLGKVIYSTHDDVVLDGRSVDMRDYGYLLERGVILDDGFYFAESELMITIPKGTILDEHLTLITVTCTDDNGDEYQCGEVLEIAGVAMGKNADEPLSAYQWSTSSSIAPSPLPNGESLGLWSKTAPNRPAVTGEYYLWMTQTTKHLAADGTVTIDPWQPAVRISGNNGSNGEDGSDMEYIYILKTQSTVFSGDTLPKNISRGKVHGQGDWIPKADQYTTDDYVPEGWSDNPAGIDNTNKYEYMSWRRKPTGTNQQWGDFSDPILWSHYGRNGIDGDGVEYVYIRTKQAVAPTLDTTQTGYSEAEFLPAITNKDACEAESNTTTDDAVGVDATYRYEWMAKRTMTDPDADGQRTWTKFQGSKVNNVYDYKMSLWAYRPENITKKSETAYYIKNTTGVRPAGNDPNWSETKPTVNQGEWLFTKTVITWSDNSTTILYTDERNPADGVPGQDIVVDGATVMKYSCKDSNTIDPTTINDWADYNQVTKTKGWWLWSKATTYYKKATDGTSAGSSINYNVSYIAEDGTSPYFADIDNEMDSVACDYQGNILAAYDTYVGVHIWHGSTEQAITTLTTNSITGITITPDAANKRIRVQIAAGTNIAAVNAIVITIASVNSGNKTLRFTLNGVRPGAPGDDAVIYSLLPSTDVITKKKDGSYVPAGTSNITCAVKKRVGNGDQEDAPASEYTLKYKKDNDSQESVFPAAGIRINTIESTIQFILYDKASTPHVVDRERVPVVADGTDGRAITGTSEHYKVSNLDGSTGHQEAKPIPDGQENASLEWTTDPNAAIASWGENAKYLWNYEKVVYSSGTTPVRTTPRVIAIWTEDGAPGRGIDSIVNMYCITNSDTAPLKTDTTVGWDDDPMAPTEEEPYLWNYEYIVWTDGTSTYASATVHLLGHYGADGTNSATLHLEQSNVFVQTDKNNAIVVESGNNYTVEIPFYVIAGGEALAHYSAQLQEGGTTHYATLGGAGVWDVSGNVFTREGTGVSIEGAYISGRGIVLPDGMTFAPSTIILTFPKNGTLDEHRVNLTVVALDSDNKEYTVFGTVEIKGRMNGEDGYNTASVLLYQRYAPTTQNPTPAKPNGTLTYTFSSGVLSGASASFNGWTQAIPAVEPNTKLFVTMATARSKEATDTIAANEWATPVEYVSDGDDGKNTVRLALDNEHEDFIYNDAGTCIAPSGGAKSVIHLYDGPEEVSLTTSMLTIDNSSSGVPTTGANRPTIITEDGKIKLSVPQITGDSAKVVVKCTYNTNDYFAEFTGNKTSQDKYDLKLTPNAIAFNSSETWADKTITPSAERTDLQGNKTTGLTIQTTAVDGLRLYYSYVKTDGTLLDSSLNLLTTATFSLTQTPANTYIGIYFELRLYSGNNFRMCDNETVEIAKAENGSAGLSAASVIIYKRSASQPSETAGSRDVPDNNSRYYFKTVGSGSSEIKAGSLVPPTGGSLHGWSLAMPGQDNGKPLWSRQASALALATASYDAIEDAEWSTAEKVVANGDDGEAAVNVIVSPASLIVNQDLEDPDNLDSLSEQILFSVMKGKTPLSVTRIEVPSTGDNVPVNCEVTGSDSYYATLTAISKDSEGKYYDNGYFICNVYYTDGGSTKSVNGIKVKVYANLLGSWAERVEADAKIEVARSLTYGYDPNYDPETEDPLPLENFGEYIKSSEINVSTLTKKVNDGKNLLSGVLTAMGWMSDTTATSLSHAAKIDSNDWIKVGVSGDTYLKTPPFQIESGKSYKISFETSSTAAVSVQVRRVDTGAAIATWTTDSGNVYHVAGWDSTYSGTVFVIVAATGLRHPQVEEGTEATAFEASTSETSSQIKQTADGITQTVNKISPSKNMFKGALSGEGWKSLASAKAVSGAPAVKLDTDGYMNTVEGGSYIEKDVTLSDQKTYTLSFYSKKTTTINVTIFVIGYPSMSVSYNIEGPVPESERKVLTFTLPAGLSGTMGISINATNIRFPQIELGSSPTDFIADTVETSSQITQTADEIKEVIHDELGETGIDIAHGEIELKANKTKFSTSAGVPMIAVQMCNANGEVGTGSGYTIPSIVFYNGQIGASGVTAQWVLNYLGFISATNAGVRYSFTGVYNILCFDTPSGSKVTHVGADVLDTFNSEDMASDNLFNRFYKEAMYLFNSGYYINDSGTKIYQPTQGAYYEMYDGMQDMRRYWLTQEVNNTFIPDATLNAPASGYYFIKASDDPNYYKGGGPSGSDWNIHSGGGGGSGPIWINQAAVVFHLVYFNPSSGAMSSSNPAGSMIEYRDAFVVFYEFDSTGRITKDCLGLIGGNTEFGNNPDFNYSFSIQDVIDKYNE